MSKKRNSRLAGSTGPSGKRKLSSDHLASAGIPNGSTGRGRLYDVIDSDRVHLLTDADLDNLGLGPWYRHRLAVAIEEDDPEALQMA